MIQISPCRRLGQNGWQAQVSLWGQRVDILQVGSYEAILQSAQAVEAAMRPLEERLKGYAGRLGRQG